jgi:hypothetical protein
LCGAAALLSVATANAASITRAEADVNQDGAVNSIDLGWVAAQLSPRADVNGDGVVNSIDLGLVATHVAVPGRDKYKQPFSSDSPWNMPIGSDAVYVDTGFGISTGGYTVLDTDVWVVTSAADPLVPVFNDQHVWTGPRCSSTVPTGIFMRLPHSLVVGDVSPAHMPNRAAAILQPDGRTIRQFNAFARCIEGGAAYGVPFPTTDIYGTGILGGHGASSLSSIGGTIRLGELMPGRVIRHALKLNLHCSTYCSPLSGPGGGPGYRWPAISSDRWCGGYACGYGGTTPGLHMGSLLALPPHLDPETITAPGQGWAPGLETEVGRRLFEALRDYGAYVVDDHDWPGVVYALHTERGVQGEVEAQYGINMDGARPTDTGVNGAFWRDWHRLMMNLKLVDNNGPSSVGGGGTPRVPLSPPLGN